MAVDTTGIQAEVAKFITELHYDGLPPEIVKDAKYRVLDWVGGALTGAGYKASRIIADMVKTAGGSAQATLIRGGMKIPLAQAALANGLIGHVAEYDDGHRLAIGHPGAIVLPTALAVAEGFGKNGRDLLTAVVAGYEVFIRLGTAVNPSHYKTWHTTGTCGVFGAAAAAAHLLKLDRRQTQMALGIVGTMAAGFLETLGTYAKPLNAAHACQSGVEAALLAQAGFTGPEDILLGDKGFIKSTAAQYDITVLSQINAGRLLANTAFYKLYASCGHTNSPLDAVFLLGRESAIPVESIQQIRVETYRTAVELTGRFRNQDEEEAKFSLPYCIAVALLYNRVTLAEFTPDKLHDPRIAALAKKTTVIEDPAATAAFPARRATVTIEFNNGSTLTKSVRSSNDAVDYPALETKFLALAGAYAGPAAAERLKELILGLEDMRNIQELTGLLIE